MTKRSKAMDIAWPSSNTKAQVKQTPAKNTASPESFVGLEGLAATHANFWQS